MAVRERDKNKLVGIYFRKEVNENDKVVLVSAAGRAVACSSEEITQGYCFVFHLLQRALHSFPRLDRITNEDMQVLRSATSKIEPN